ncbi:VWA domain-containing protein, partial [Luteolibacter marinus]|uniref:VWA domain-containing protein n=1 Tax=Luteolibacter marinus TaxID=2776705 RepID=UPI0018691107
PPPGRMLGAVKRLAESGVTLIGLASLDAGARPCYDEAMGRKLAGLGMDITAATPKQFAEWLATKIS